MIIIENKNNIVKSFKLKQKESIIFINCKNCKFIIPDKINKIIIYNCQDSQFNLYTTISSLEITKCTNLYILIYGTLMTTQIDLVIESQIHFLKNEGYVISCGTNDVLITTPLHNLILPYHAFLQQNIINLKTWEIKRREECLDSHGFLILN